MSTKMTLTTKQIATLRALPDPPAWTGLTPSSSAYDKKILAHLVITGLAKESKIGIMHCYQRTPIGKSYLEKT